MPTLCNAIPKSNIPPEIKNARDGLALMEFVWNHLDDGSKDKRELKLLEFNQMSTGFGDADTVLAAIDAKLDIADAINQLTSGDDVPLAEHVIVHTMMRMFPYNDTWQSLRNDITALGKGVNRTKLIEKVKLKLMHLGVGVHPASAFGAHDDGEQEDASAASHWKKRQGRGTKEYRDPEHLYGRNKGNRMDEKGKIKLLIEYIQTLDKAPHLDIGDYKKFMNFAHANHVGVDVAHKVSDMYEAQLALEADSSEYSEDETGGMAVTLGDDLDTIYDEIMAELAMERS